MNSQPFVDFQGKYVVVTGATSGIGEAIAVELSRRGARPVLVGRSMKKLEDTASRLESPEHEKLCVDLIDQAGILPRVQELCRKTGRIYGVCHAAGTADTAPLSSCSIDKLRAMLDVNMLAGIEIARAVCRRDVMEESGGSVLFISSIYGVIGMPGEIAYSASKGGMIAAARAMAVELARRGIRVNTISPGLVKTRMTDEAFSLLEDGRRKEIENAHPLGTGTPEDVARAAVFLLAPQNTWITGVNLVIDGGYTAR